MPDKLFDADDHTLAGRSDWIVRGSSGLIRAPAVGDVVPEPFPAPLRMPSEASAMGTPGRQGLSSSTSTGRSPSVCCPTARCCAAITSLVVRDLPNPPIIETVNALRDAGHEIIFCSADPSVTTWDAVSAPQPGAGWAGTLGG